MRKKSLKPQSATAGMILAFFGLMVGIMRFYVLDKLAALYSDFDVPLPFITSAYLKYGYVIAGIIVVAGILLIGRSSQDIKTLKVTADKPLVPNSNPAIEIGTLFAIGLLVAFMIIAIIMPIYNLTETL